MATTKIPLYVTLGTDSEMIFQGDPEIYSSANNLVLGISSTKGANKKTIAATIAQIGKSSGAGILKCTCTNGTGDDQETRVVRVLCEASKLDTAKTDMVGKTFLLGNTVTKTFTVRSVRV